MSAIFSVLFFLSSAYADGKFTPIVEMDKEVYNKNAALCCFLDWGTSGWLSQKTKFPNASLYSLSQGKIVEIKDLVKDKPIVLQMGSVTCPSYDINVEAIKRLEKKYKGKVDFYTVYVRENHPANKYQYHTSVEQKLDYAKDLIKLDGIKHEVLIDDIKGSFHQMMGNFGNSIYVVGKDMHVNHWSIFPRGANLDKALKALIKARGNGANAKYIAGTYRHPMYSQDYSAADKEKVKAKMHSREDMAKPYPTDFVLAEYEEFKLKNPEIYKSMNEGIRVNMQELGLWQSKYYKSQTTERKLEFRKKFNNYEDSFLDEYQRRLSVWLQKNKLEEKVVIKDLPILEKK